MGLGGLGFRFFDGFVLGLELQGLTACRDALLGRLRLSLGYRCRVWGSRLKAQSGVEDFMGLER